MVNCFHELTKVTQVLLCHGCWTGNANCMQNTVVLEQLDLCFVSASQVSESCNLSLIRVYLKAFEIIVAYSNLLWIVNQAKGRRTVASALWWCRELLRINLCMCRLDWLKSQNSPCCFSMLNMYSSHLIALSLLSLSLALSETQADGDF